MGNAATAARNALSTKDDHRILMVGLDNAGKTTLLYRIKLNDTVNTIPTIGFQVETVEWKNFSFTVWDTSGQDKIRPLWRHYYKATSALIWVIDSNERDKFIESKKELNLLIFNEPELQQTIPLLIYANKKDINECMDIDEIIQRLFEHSMINIIHKQYLYDNYQQKVSEIIIKHYEKDNDINDINKEICQLIIEYIPCQGIIGTIGDRPFCILPTSALNGFDGNILKGLDWIDNTLNSNNDCLIM